MELRPLSDVVEAVRTLRALGASSVAIGDVSVVFAPANFDAPVKERTPEEIDREFNATLMHSAG
jgi:hypothetical protein